jgi:hypothetical protein
MNKLKKLLPIILMITVILSLGQSSLVLSSITSLSLDRQNVALAEGTATNPLYIPLVSSGLPPVNVFGIDMGAVVPQNGLNQFADAGTQWVRRGFLTWADVEPTEGARNWNALSDLETEMVNASSHGMNMLLIIHQTPSWAQELSGSTCGRIKSTKIAAFAKFVGDVVARYSQAPYNVKHWEIWNEPDYPQVVGTDGYGCWGDPSDTYYGGGYYATVLKQVYPAVKAVDSYSQVIVGGLLLDCDPNNPPPNKDCTPGKYLQGILANGGGNYLDGVSYHTYEYYDGTLDKYSNTNWNSHWNTTGTTVKVKAEFIKNVLNAYHISNKAIYSTESALLCLSNYYSCDSTFETTKANYVAMVFADTKAEGLQTNVWYSAFGWRDSGLINSNLSPKPAFYAYQFAQKEFGTAQFSKMITDYAGVRGFEFYHGGRTVWLLASQDGSSHALNLPGTPVAMWDVLGNSITPASSIQVTTAPVYVEWNP